MSRRRDKIQLSTKLSTRKAVDTPTRHVLQVGRNDACPCGSRRKYKDCHESEGETFLSRLAKQQVAARLKEERKRLKEAGVPWYQRLFIRV